MGYSIAGGRRLKFRAKISKAGEKIIIIIPVKYHREVKQWGDTPLVDVEIEEIE